MVRVVPLIVCWLLAVAGHASPQRPTVVHVPPVSARPQVALPLTVALSGADLSDVAEAAAIVEGPDGTRDLAMTVSGGRLALEIPAALVATPTLRYRLVVLLVDGTELESPPGGAFYRVPVVGEATGVGADIVSPGAHQRLSVGQPIELAVVFDPPLEAPWEAVALLDGEDVTETTVITQDLLVSGPIADLTQGAHTFVVSVLTASRIVEASRTFLVAGRTLPVAMAPTLTLHGRVEIGWAAAMAETTASDTVDVLLPYDEVSRPALSFYASGFGARSSLTAWASYDPVYDDRLTGSLRLDTERLGVEIGDVFPALTPLSMEWAAGLGATADVRLGPTTTSLVALRLSEADTVAGFGWYSRFSVGASERMDVGGNAGLTVAWVRTFDREESIPEETQIDDPLTNDVVAAVASASSGALEGEVEVARSSSDGEFAGDGTAVRVRLAFERDYSNRVALEYTRSDSSYYAPASVSTEPGREGLESEFALECCGARASGSVGAFRTSGSVTGVDPDAVEWRTAVRVDLKGEAGGGAWTSYGSARYDLVPYAEYDYRLVYATAGASYRHERWNAAVRASWSVSESETRRTDLGVAVSVEAEISPDRWTVEGGVRRNEAGGDDDDASRIRTTVESRWTFDELELTGRWEWTDREDRAEPAQSYTESLVRVGLAVAF